MRPPETDMALVVAHSGPLFSMSGRPTKRYQLFCVTGYTINPRAGKQAAWRSPGKSWSVLDSFDGWSEVANFGTKLSAHDSALRLARELNLEHEASS